MADTIHKKKKDWPHFNKIHLSSQAYAEGYDRIFGRNDDEEEYETRGRRSIQKTRRKVAKKGSQKPKSARRIHRSKEIREDQVSEDGIARKA